MQPFDVKIFTRRRKLSGSISRVSLRTSDDAPDTPTEYITNGFFCAPETAWLRAQINSPDTFTSQDTHDRITSEVVCQGNALDAYPGAYCKEHDILSLKAPGPHGAYLGGNVAVALFRLAPKAAVMPLSIEPITPGPSGVYRRASFPLGEGKFFVCMTHKPCPCFATA